MKTVIIICAALLSLAFCQVPTNTNPVGEEYFSPSTVFSLSLNQTVTGTIYNTSDYTDFYKLWIPSNVGSLRFILNNTADCSNYIEAYIDFVEPYGDNTVSFPCYYADNAYCDSYDTYLEAYSNSDSYSEYDAGYNYRPGKWAYISITNYYSGTDDCTYAFRAESSFECPVGSYVVTESTYSCYANTSITNITTMGQTFVGSFASSTEIDVFRLDVPRNVTRVWAWVQSSSSSLYLSATAGYVANDYYADDEDTWNYMDNGNYSYLVELIIPDGNYPIFFAVLGSASDTYIFNAYWSYCGSSTAGYGSITNYYSYANSSFSIPDCSDPIVNNNVGISTIATSGLTVSVPGYNGTVDTDAGSVYAVVNIPSGTVGGINLTCNATGYSYVAFAWNSLVDCDYYASYFYCSYPGNGYTNFFLFVSNDLYNGGFITLAICNEDSTPTTVNINSAGTLTQAASASPSPGSGVSPSSSPGASSTGEDSSVSSVFPVLLITVLAAIISL